MNNDEFKKKCEDHRRWLDTRCSWNASGVKMELQYEVIRGEWKDIDLSHVNMNRCIFRNARFERCKFYDWQAIHSSFFGCVFVDCEFIDASFSGGTLYCCEFNKCSFDICSFTCASIDGCEFLTSRLENCSFFRSNIQSSSFESAEFAGRLRFENANIENSYLPSDLRNILGRTLDKPIVGYKKTREGVVIKAEIPAGAIVYSINGNKCRTNRAKIVDMHGHAVLHSLFDASFSYELGQDIEILDFDPCYSHECAPGFHFFMTEKEAEEYRV